MRQAGVDGSDTVDIEAIRYVRVEAENGRRRGGRLERERGRRSRSQWGLLQARHLSFDNTGSSGACSESVACGALSGVVAFMVSRQSSKEAREREEILTVEAVAAVGAGGAPTTVPPMTESAEAEDNEARKSS